MSNRLGGKQGTAYLGTNASQPPNWIFADRNPTVYDFQNVSLGDLWLNQTDDLGYILVSLDNNLATWHPIGASTGTVIGLIDNAGLVATADANHNISVPGGSNITTSKFATSQLDINLNSSINIQGLTISSLGAGLMQTDATGIVTSNNDLNGKLMIAGGAAPAWNFLESSGGTVTITYPGPNRINLEAAGAAGLQQLNTDAGGPALPLAGAINMFGGTNINTDGLTANTVKVNLDDNVTLAGTLTLSALGAGVMQTDASGVVTSDNGTDGQVIIGGGTAPAWNNITSSDGSIIITYPAPNTINLEAAGGSGPWIGEYGFLAYQASNLYDLPFNAVPYYIGSQSILTEMFDKSGGLYVGDGVGTPAQFTCPATGKWLLTFNISVQIMRTAGTVAIYSVCQTKINTPARNYIVTNMGWENNLGYDYVFPKQCITTIADLTVGDIVQWSFETQLKANCVYYILGSSAPTTEFKTWISGCRIAL
jgi:hypothetical protein